LKGVYKLGVTGHINSAGFLSKSARARASGVNLILFHQVYQI
jgi:hypothetical protein